MSTPARSGPPATTDDAPATGAGLRGPNAMEGLPTDRPSRAIIAGFRILVAMLWLTNVGWKYPPDFGEGDKGGLYHFTHLAIEHPVFAPFTWVVREVVLPNFRVFGWTVFVVEACLGGFLLVGLFTRFWAIVGVAQSIAIALSVLNAANEWPWSYYLMIGAHLVLFATAAGRVAGLDGILRPLWRARDTRGSHLALLAS